ncbi:hypothetical protein GCM10023226_04950 [Nocardioides nanhaiensis]|uniref:Sensor domain-containing protein n=1 Tax=Nocardioides nanhaiensis TaxID=1476871 RepID=A0ABP8VTN2_9ACTN
MLLAVLLVAGVGVGGFFGVRALTGDDEPAAGGGGTSESSEPTDEPTDQPTDEPTDEPTEEPTGSGGAPEPILDACQGAAPVTGATRPGQALRGGGLRVTTPPGYEPSAANEVFTFGDGVAAVGQQVEEFWLSLYALGSLPDIGYESPQQAAETVVECMVRSELFYSGFQDRTDLTSEPVSLAGAEGWRITTEIRVQDPRITVEGDHATVVVAPREDGSLSLFVSVVPIGDDTRIAQQEATLAELLD